MVGCLLLSLSPSTISDFPEDAPHPPATPDVILWFASDMHCNAPEDSGQWDTAIDDVENLTSDFPTSDFYGYAIGDLTSSGLVAGYQQFHNEYNRLNDEFVNISYVYGNHDPLWNNDPGWLVEDTTWGNYTKTIGNILIIALSTERNWTASNTAIYSHQTAWWNSTVQANQDKNLITVAHHGIYDTTPGTNYTNPAEGGGGCFHMNWTDDTPVFNYTLDNYKMNMYVHGHNHFDLSQTWYGRKYINNSYNDTYQHYFINDGGIMDYISGTTPYPHDTESVFLFLYDNNDTAILCRRNHTIGKWYETNQTIQLDYAFREDGVNSPPVISAPVPSNNTVGMDITLSNLSFTINDSDGDLMNYTIEYGGLSYNFDSISNGSQTPIINYGAINPLDYATTYYWYVNATDGELWGNYTFNFQTKANTPPAQSAPFPGDTTTEIVLTPTNMSITVSDTEGHTMNVSFYTNESGTWQLADQNLTVPNGTYPCVNTTWIDTYNTTYWWSVNVTDGYVWTNTTRSFTTFGAQASNIRITGTMNVYDPTTATNSVIIIAGIFMLASAFMFIAIYIWNKNGGIL